MVVVTCVITVISMSPSMRREWIEISNEHDLHQTANSLPPCGGSGLKYLSGYLRGRRQQSPSMRREWIEIADFAKDAFENMVSLHAEGVD